MIARYPDRTQEVKVSPNDDPCGVFVAGQFLEVRWPSPNVAVLDVEGKLVELPKRTSTQFTFVGVVVQALHT